MDAADTTLFLLMALADVCLMVHLHRRRQRRNRLERMMRSLRLAVQRETGSITIARPEAHALVLQQAS
jgi:hypothetical protein